MPTLRLEGLPWGPQAPPSTLGPPGLEEEDAAGLRWEEWQTERSPLAEGSEQTSYLSTMCTGKCSRLLGLALVAAALACMAANILLLFPNAKSQWTPEHITTQAWLMGGIIGGGLMVLCTGCSSVRAGGKGCCGYGCCGNRCRMLRSVFCSIFGGLGAFYCLVVSCTALADGPWCETVSQKWESPFKGLSDSYLKNQTMWTVCLNPPSIVLWHIVLFSILLGLSLLEMVLCGIQVVNGLLGTVCGDCRKDEDRAGEGL